MTTDLSLFVRFVHQNVPEVVGQYQKEGSSDLIESVSEVIVVVLS